jgi:hypothetical protein
MLEAVTSITSTNPRQSTACPSRPATVFPSSWPTASAPTLSAAHRICESMIAAVGGRLKAYTSEKIGA